MMYTSRLGRILRWMTTHHHTRKEAAMGHHHYYAAGGGVGAIDPHTCTHEQWQAYRATIDPHQLSDADFAVWQQQLDAYTARCQRESEDIDRRTTAVLDARDAAEQQCEQISDRYAQVQEQIAEAQATLNAIDNALMMADGAEADQLGDQRHQVQQYLNQLYDTASALHEQEQAALAAYEQARWQARRAS